MACGHSYKTAVLGMQYIVACKGTVAFSLIVYYIYHYYVVYCPRHI